MWERVKSEEGGAGSAEEGGIWDLGRRAGAGRSAEGAGFKVGRAAGAGRRALLGRQSPWRAGKRLQGSPPPPPPPRPRPVPAPTRPSPRVQVPTAAAAATRRLLHPGIAAKWLPMEAVILGICGSFMRIRGYFCVLI